MPKVLSKFQQRRAMRRAAKEIYRKAFMKAKAEELRKARARARKEIEAAAVAAAKKKYGKTKAERRKEIGKKVRDIAQRMAKLSEGFESTGGGLAFDFDMGLEDLGLLGLAPQKKKKTTKKKRKK